MKENIKSNNLAYQIAFTGIIISISLIFRFASIMLPLASVAAIRIDLSTPFMKLPGIIFGPVIGAISGGLVDLIGYFLKPMGAYIPWFTITSMMVCVLTALLYKYTKDIDNNKFKNITMYSFITLGIIGVFNLSIQYMFPNSFISNNINKLGDKAIFATVLLIIISILGLLSIYITNKLGNSEFYKLLIIIAIPAILHTTLNTIVLQKSFVSLASKGFFILWVPRLIEELVMIPIEAYLIVILLNVYKKWNFGK